MSPAERAVVPTGLSCPSWCQYAGGGHDVALDVLDFDVHGLVHTRPVATARTEPPATGPGWRVLLEQREYPDGAREAVVIRVQAAGRLDGELAAALANGFAQAVGALAGINSRVAW